MLHLTRWIALTSCLLSFPSSAQEGNIFGPRPDQPPPPSDAEEAPPAKPVKPSVTQLDESRFQIGLITFNKTTREIRFPAKVNMTEGLLEYLVVHEKGKLHESLFSTTISPTDLRIAFTLLRYQPSRELYPEPDPSDENRLRFPNVNAEIKAKARVLIEAEWDEGDKKRKLSVNEMIQHEVKTTSMPVGPWVFGGSDFQNGKYIPELTGDIAAIYSEFPSILNYPGEDHGDDTVWIPFPKRVPTPGTPVTIIITPHQKPQPAPKP